MTTEQSTEKKTTHTLRDLRDQIAELIIESFPDEAGQPWAHYHDHGHLYLSEIEGEAFADWIRLYIHDNMDQPREAWVEPIVKYLASRARRNPKRTLELRRAIDKYRGAWVFQLDREDQLAISTDGKFTVEPLLPIFRVFGHQDRINIDYTATPNDLNRIDQYLNLANPWELDLFKSILPAYLVPGIAKPLLLSRGEPGSAKSTFGRLLKRIIDPSSTMRTGIAYPNNEGDWYTIARQHEVIILDNLGYLKREQQDELCRTITGRDIERRKLYTDSESVGSRIQRIVAANGIDFEQLNADFLDRSYIGDLKRIDGNRQLPETIFWDRFEHDLPKIRGALFRILANARADAERITPPRTFRLMDFARYAAACAKARGQDPAEFLQQLTQKSELQKDESIAQSTVFEPLTKFMQEREDWEGTMNELLRSLTEAQYGRLEGRWGEERVVVRDVPKTWFKTPQALGIALKQVSFLLPRVGLQLLNPSRTINGVHFLKITKIVNTSGTQTVLSSENSGAQLAKSTDHPLGTCPPAGCPGGNGVGTDFERSPPGFVDDKNARVPRVPSVSAPKSLLRAEPELVVVEEDLVDG